jgi:trimeric autotransporter adhesin
MHESAINLQGERTMREKKAITAVCLAAFLALSPAVGLAQSTTTFSGEGVALKATALGISLGLGDTGALPSSGGSLSNSVASVNLAGIVSADALKSSTSGSGSSSQSQSTLQDVSLLNGLVSATEVESNSSVSCSSSGQASASGNAQLVGLTVAGQSIPVSSPNFSVSLPGGISVIINQQTSSSGGTSGSMTVSALHVTGPAIDIVVASANSGITCSSSPIVD